MMVTITNQPNTNATFFIIVLIIYLRWSFGTTREPFWPLNRLQSRCSLYRGFPSEVFYGLTMYHNLIVVVLRLRYLVH